VGKPRISFGTLARWCEIATSRGAICSGSLGTSAGGTLVRFHGATVFAMNVSASAAAKSPTAMNTVLEGL
jgi:hypothetical protein